MSTLGEKPSLNAPLIHIGKQEIPLYTSKLGRGALKLGANVLGYTTEGVRGIRDRVLGSTLEVNLEPEPIVVDTAGLKVCIEVPVTQIKKPGTTRERVRAATDGLLRTGKFDLKPKLPPGDHETRNPHSTTPIQVDIIPTPSYEEGKLRPFSRSAGAGNRSGILAKLNPYWPKGKLTFAGTDLDQGWKILKNRRQQISPAHQAAIDLLPDLNLEATINYLDPSGSKQSKALIFHLGETPIEFDNQGNVKESAFAVNGVFFHPALLSLKDFANVVSAGLRRESGGVATIDPERIIESTLLAPGADEDTREVIEPYVARMMAIGRINQLLTQAPGEFSIALAKIANFTDKDGNLHPQAEYIATEVIGAILGLKDAPTKHGRPLTYVGFISMINQTLKSYEASLQWGGNANLVVKAVEQSKNMPELYALVQEMGVTNPESLTATRTVWSAGEFFSLVLTPEILFTNAMTVLKSEYVQAIIAKSEALRALHRLQIIEEVVLQTTQIDKKYWGDALAEFQAKIAKMKNGGGSKVGTIVAQKIKDQYESKEGQEGEQGPETEIIDGEIKQSKPRSNKHFLK